MKKYVFVVLAIALFLQLSGCVQSPNDNLYYADCCPQSDSQYTCEAKKSGDEFILNSDKLVVLDGCGECKYWDRIAGLIYGDGGLSSGPLVNAQGDYLNPKDCENNCNFQQTDCTNTDGENTCYLASNPDIKVAPICADATPNPCVQNECAAMVCNKMEPKVRLTANSAGLQSQAVSGSSASRDYDESGGLYGKACSIMRLDSKTANILKKEDSFVNAFRLGIQGTFSDYDRARYYLPPSDFYSGNAQTDSVVDRFTKYLEGEEKLSEFATNYYTPLHHCLETSGCWSCDPAVSQDLANIKFCESDYSSNEAAEVACAKICSNAQMPQCSDNSELIVANVSIAPPYSKNPQTQPFVDVQKYYKLLDEAYPVEESEGYYHALPKITSDMSEQELQDAIDELLKPGPGGGRVFECLDNSDCMSSNCDKSSYSRSACVDNEGNTVECGCRLVDNCDVAYMCDAFTPNTREHKYCYFSKLRCEWTEKPALVCDYDPIKEEEKKIITSGGNSVDWRSLSDFGDKDLDPGNTGIDLEFVNVQKLTDKQRCYGVYEGMEPMWTDMTYYCPDGYSENPNAQGTEDACISIDEQYTSKQTKCQENYEKKRYYYWADDTSGFDKGIKWNYGSSFWIAPYAQAVWTGAWGGYGGVIITDRSIDFDKLKTKMPLIEACNLQLGEDIGDGTGTGDIFKVDASKYEGLEEDANKLPVLVNYEDSGLKWRWDSTWKINRRWDPTTKTLGLGDCQIEMDGTPVVMTYGICKPGGSMLSLAYQNVSSYVPTTEAQQNYCPWGDPFCEIYGYCPKGCISRWTPTGGKCYCPQDKTYVYPTMPASPATDPEFSHLASKINEYQSAEIMPILDLREYYINTGQGMTKTYNGISESECEQLGGEYTDKECLEGDRWYCTKWEPAKCTLDLGQKNDYLLSYLQNNRSAVILLVADVPDDCADGTPGATEGPNCKNAISKIRNASLICPDCMLAVEYNQTIEVATQADTYPDDLKNALSAFAGGVEYRPQYFGPQWDIPSNTPLQMKEVDVLMLNVDFSSASASQELMKEQIQNTINISRKVLQHVGYTTIYKLQIPKDGGAQKDGQYMNEEFYHTINSLQSEMVSSGMLGMLLPPLDNADTDASQYSQEEYGRLLSDSIKTLEDVDKETLPFCPAQMGSTSFLHPQITVALQKSISRDICECIPCSDFERDTGQCGTEAALCLDNSPCQILVNADTNTYRDALGGEAVKCEPGCFTWNKATKCSDSSEVVTCRKIESSNSPPTACNGPLDLENGCGIITFALSELESNAYFYPYQSELLAGLSNDKKCYVQDGQQNATYESLLTTKTSAQPLIFPIYGATTTDCGVGDIDDEDITSCQQSKIPLPVRKSAWVCS